MKSPLRILQVPLFLLLPLATWSVGRATEPTPSIDFAREIQPILAKRCLSCHGADEAARKKDLRLDTFESATALRDEIRAIAPGKPGESSILSRIRDPDDDRRMPPPESGARLTDAEIEKLSRWIAQGAPYSEHWAFIAPRKSPPRGSLFDSLAHDELDRHVFAELVRHDLAPARPADRRTWLRRVSLDLTGLPPTLEDAKHFDDDTSERAFEHVVDRLLGSPAYGERMTRLWLDIARYADSAGYGSDPLRTIYRYRDYVIDAFNANRHLDDFVIEQLAGDLLPNPTEDQRLATAFHRNTLTNTEGGTDDEEFRVAAVKDRANVTMQAFMGLTFGCAQCHSHKFDPISHEEYYRLFAFFDQTEDADQPDESPVLATPRREDRERLSALEAESSRMTTAYESAISTLVRAGSPALDSWLRDVADRASSFQPLAFGPPQGIHDTSGGNRVIAFPGPREAIHALELRFRSPPDSAPSNSSERNVRIREVEPRRSLPVARFVRIELPGAERILSLAEVEIFSRGANVARGKPVSQSSTAFGGPPERAVDGKRDGEFDNASVTHTATENDPWFEVDLGAEIQIERIEIWNRTDNGNGRRLDGAIVRLLDSTRTERASDSIEHAADSNPIDPSQVRRAVAVRRIGQADGDGSSRFVFELERPITTSFELEISNAAEWSPDSLAVHGSAASGSPFLAVSTANLAAIREPSLRDAARSRALVDLAAPFLPELSDQHEAIERIRAELSTLPRVSTPILRELPPERRRTTHVLAKGNFLDRGKTVTPGVPAKFHPWKSELPPDRLGLARWVTARENPLFARVFVNRMWSMLFGRGLVFTEEDFGIQGAPPENQELLDSLAVDFAASGYDIKALLRRIVLSYTYRQDSRVDDRTAAIDPDNKWLARGPRHRVDAEIVRDQSLAVAGLLSDKRFGPPVYPPQPDGLWRAAFNGERSYVTSAGEDRHRRSLYTVWRRTVPYPSLATFDAPSRETCALRRSRTNTPLQAFVTLNDPAFVECAQGLARRVLSECTGDDPSRVTYAIELTTLAKPDPRAVEELVELLRSEREHYRVARVDARTLATDPLGPLPAGLDEAEAAAWTVVANVLLNQDAFLTKG